MQQGILFHCLRSPGSGLYIDQECFELTGDLHSENLQNAWLSAVELHPVLRTSFHWKEVDKTLQVVHRYVDLPWDQQDWRNVSQEEQKRDLEIFLHADRMRGFQFDTPPLMRITLIRLTNDTSLLIWTVHHLLLDGWSSTLVLKDVFSAYKALCSQNSLTPTPSRSYRSYISWIQKQDTAAAELFWRKELRGFTTPIRLAVGKAWSEISYQEFDYAECHIHLSAEITASLQRLAREQHLTLNTFIQGAWTLLLSRYSGESDVVFGTVVSGRPAELKGVESIVGLFINTLPLRTAVVATMPLLEWLDTLQAKHVEARQYEYSPLAEVQRWSEVPVNLPLFESVVVFQNYPGDATLHAMGETLSIRDKSSNLWRTGYPLIVMASTDATLLLQISYSADRFNRDTIERMLTHLQSLLEGMLAHPTARLGELPLLTAAEREQLLYTWNATEVPLPFPPDTSFSQLLEEQVARTPEAVALVVEERHWTYQALDELAGHLAYQLQTLGVGPECRVAVLADRDIELTASLLAILKAGGAYLPLEPRHPLALHLQILESSRPTLVLATIPYLPLLAEVSQNWQSPAPLVVKCLNDMLHTSTGQQGISRKLVPHQLSYVMYTSGSTGKPKGAMIEQRGMLNHLYAKIAVLNLNAADVVAQNAPQCFNVAVWQLLAVLLVGGCTHILPDKVAQDPKLLLEQVEQQGISVIEIVPHLIQAAVEELERSPRRPTLKHLRWLIPTGEALQPELCRLWLALFPQIPLVNTWGSTECSDDVTHHVITRPLTPDAVHTPLGSQIANIQIYVLDRALEPVPVGVMGEAYVGGIGVGRGYLGNPERTAETFIPDPFCKEPGRRLYKTGDWVRYQPDRSLEFLGRLDTQVKFRGNRIELGEIEVVLMRHPAVRLGVVIIDESKTQEKLLVAYIVPMPDSSLNANELRNYMQRLMPSYMVPSIFLFQDTLPLTDSGKIDRKRLPAPNRIGTVRSQNRVAPRTPTERLVATIWADVLGVEEVGVDDNFFELGGHSLTIMRILSRIEGEFAVDISIRDYFATPTIEGLARKIEEMLIEQQSPEEVDQLLDLLEQTD